MGLEETIGFALALLVMFVGLVGCVVPGIPGTPLILAGAIGHRIYFGAASVSNWVLLLLVVMMLLSIALEHLAGMIGAKKLGSTWRGAVGAVVGGLVGLFFSIPGILLGPFVGATLFELIGGREFKLAAKAGAGATIGLVLGGVGKISLAVAMILLFCAGIVFR